MSPGSDGGHRLTGLGCSERKATNLLRFFSNVWVKICKFIIYLDTYFCSIDWNLNDAVQRGLMRLPIHCSYKGSHGSSSLFWSRWLRKTQNPEQAEFQLHYADFLFFTVVERKACYHQRLVFPAHSRSGSSLGSIRGHVWEIACRWSSLSSVFFLKTEILSQHPTPLFLFIYQLLKPWMAVSTLWQFLYGCIHLLYAALLASFSSSPAPTCLPTPIFWLFCSDFLIWHVGIFMATGGWGGVSAKIHMVAPSSLGHRVAGLVDKRNILLPLVLPTAGSKKTSQRKRGLKSVGDIFITAVQVV